MGKMTKMAKPRYFQVKPAIHYGIGALDVLGEYKFKLVCIVTDESMVKFGLLKMVTDELDKHGTKYKVFDSVEPDPSTDIVREGLVHILSEKPDALIALGGGSAIDSAKAIIYYCYETKKILFEEGQIIKPTFFAIPTTAGTGSEVTEYAVITDKETGKKIPLTDMLMMPDVAILDPKFVESVPASVTAATGMDVLTHAVESFVSETNNPFSRTYSQKAVELVFRSLYDSYADGHDLEAKASMQIASCMAGIAFNSAGLGICHSIAHAIGALWHLPHGLANAIVLPFVVEFNARDEKAKTLYRRLLISIGAIYSGDKPGKYFARDIRDLNKMIGIPLSLKEQGINEAEFMTQKDEIIRRAKADICTQTNPVCPTDEEWNEILDTIYQGV